MKSLGILWNLYHLMKSQWESPEKLREIQNRKLRAILMHAYNNVPFYREKFKAAGLHPSDIRCVEDLARFPLTTKQEVRTNFPGAIVAAGTDIRKCWVAHTGGSTGIPLAVVYDKKAEEYEKAVVMRPKLAWGQNWRDKWVIICAPSHFIKAKWFQRFSFFAPVYVSIFAPVREQLALIKQLRPDVIEGATSSLFMLAKEAEQQKVELRPRLVYGDMEVLDDETRCYIDSVFGVRMYDQFGCVELARTAWECPLHNGYHIDAEAVVMEFVRNGKPVAPGEQGAIVYTSLYNYAMPLIRYAIGDIGIPSSERCACGRGLPLMKVLEGRRDDFIHLSDGTLVSPRTFSNIMKVDPPSAIEQYRIVQKTVDRFVVQIVKGRDFSEAIAGTIVRAFHEFLGQRVTVEIEIVPEIPREPSGKLRKIVSELKV